MAVSSELVRVAANCTGAYVLVQLVAYALAAWATGEWD